MDADDIDSVIDMNEYLAQDQVQNSSKDDQQSNKRKKKPYDKPKGDPELEELRKKAKSVCTCYEQWKSVSKYKKDRLKDFIEMREFDSMKNIRDNVFSTIHKCVSIAVDTITGGNGYVRDHIENDITLRTAFEEEGSNFVKYLSNRSKIAFLLTSDSVSGKMQQYKEKATQIPPEISIIQEHDQTQSASQSDQGTTISNDDMVQDTNTDTNTPRYEGENGILSMQGEEIVQSTSE